MNSEIQFDANIAPAKLPFRNEKYNVRARTGGWGLNEIHEIPQNFKTLDVVNVQGSICQETYGIHITSRTDSMCTYKNGNNRCGMCKVIAFFYTLITLFGNIY